MSFAPPLRQLAASRSRICARTAAIIVLAFAAVVLSAVTPPLAAAAPPASTLPASTAPQPSPTVLGRVVNVHGKPTSGVSVYLVAPGQPPDHLILVQGSTDAGGAFRTVVRADLQHRPLYLAALAPGFAPAFHLVIPGGTQDGRTPFEAPTLTLEPVHVVHFRLVSGDGTPVAGANVVLNQRLTETARDEAPPNGFWVPPMDFAALSDAVHLPWLTAIVRTSSVPGGWVRVAGGGAGDLLTFGVQKPGFVAMSTRLAVPAEDGLTVRMSPGAIVRGRLVREQTCDGGGVKTEPAAHEIVGWQANGVQVATGDDGRFTFTDLDAGPDYLLLKPSSGDAGATSDAALAPLWVAPAPGQTVDVGDIVATSGGKVTVTLTGDASDHDFPQRQYFVTVTRVGDAADGTANAPSSAPVDAGRPSWSVALPPQWGSRGMTDHYVFRLPAGTYQIATHSYDTGSPEGHIQETVEDGKDLTVPLSLPAPPAAGANSAPPDATKTQNGTITDAATGQPIEGAVISSYTGNGVATTARSGADGRFALSPPLPGQFYGSEPRYVLIAAAPGYAPAIRQCVVGSGDGDLAISLPSAQAAGLPVVVTDSAGQPIAGASVTTWRFPVPFGGQNQWPRQIDLPPSALDPDSAIAAIPSAKPVTATTDGSGRAFLVGVPASGFATVTVDSPGYATTYATVALPHTAAPAHVTLSRPATVTGRLRLADGSPLGGQYFQVNARGANYPFQNQTVSFPGVVDPSGVFTIAGIPSLDVIGETTLGLTADPVDQNSSAGAPSAYGRPAPLEAHYLSPDSGDIDLVVTIGGTDRYLAYAESGQFGLTYAEGAVVHHDIVFAPAAVLRGVLDRSLPPGVQTPPGSKPWGQVYYTDAHSTAYRAQAKCDDDGRFEITVPAGVRLSLGWDIGVQRQDGGWQPMVTGTAAIPPLRPQEVRNDVLPRTATDRRNEMWQIPGGPQTQSHQALLRVVGPDGATVPRPRLTWLLRGAAGPTWASATGATEQHTMGRYGVASGLDGTVEINIWGGNGIGGDASGPLELQVVSPDLSAPITVPFSWDAIERTGTPVRVRLDRVPAVVPPPQPGLTFTDNGNTEGVLVKPDRAPIGDTAPDLRVSLWYAGQPVRLSDLRGKLVVLMFDRVWTRPEFARFFHRYGHDPRLTIIGLEQGDWLSADDLSPGAEEQTKALLAIGQDPQVRDNWQPYNSIRFGSAQDAVAVIGPDGAVLAENISEPFLSALADSILTP